MTQAPSSTTRNVLFIMADQLRADYLSCYGGPVPTPNLDRLAAGGARFTRAFVNAGVCGPSRVSFYTGRYPLTHRVSWNRVPMPCDELTLGHYLADAGRPLHLLGKTHFVPDNTARLLRLVSDPVELGLYNQGGFTPVERYDGHFEPGPQSPYHQYLIRHGYQSEKPWTDFVIGSSEADGSLASGWLLRNAHLPARVAAEHSETAYLTTRAIDYMREQSDTPWALHLSYIKPHWPFKAPAPYHALFGPGDAPALNRGRAERERPHPVHAAYQQLEESQTFANREVVDSIRPVYMGLIKQLDDELGRLFQHMQDSGRMDDTLIIFTADHGDLSGDHWLGEKEYFFEPVMHVPLLIRDPAPAARARAGRVVTQMAESVDVVPTILEALGLPSQDHRVEGRSLLALTREDEPGPWRDRVYGQLDYAYREARTFLGRGPHECNGMMVREDRYKLIWWEGFASQLFDLQEDPLEQHDLGSDPAQAQRIRAMSAQLFEWLVERRRRATETTAQVENRTHAHERMMGIFIGRW